MAVPASHTMRLAIQAAREGIAKGQSPFGAVIVRGDVLIASGYNHVRDWTDPSAHAEIVCIRQAGEQLGSIDLAGCEMYTTCEPCPMCAGAIHWANLDTVHFGARIADAEGAGFRELSIPVEEVYSQGGSRVRVHPGIMRDECAALFDEWKRAGGRPY